MVFRGVVGGVTVTERLGFLALRGDGVFSTSTSLLDGDDEQLTEEVVVSRISRDIGACKLLACFLGRPGRLETSLPEGGADELTCFLGGRPGPLRLGMASVGATGVGGAGGAATTGCRVRTSGTGRSSSLLLLSDSDNRFKFTLVDV